MRYSLYIFILFAFVGCTKYTDGPAFSLLSRKSRMVNHWELDKATANGEFWTPYYPLKEMELREDFTQTSTFRTLNVPNVMTGQWEFDNRKENLKLIFSNDFTQVFRIDRLKKDELRLTIFSNDTTYKLDYITYK